MICDRKSVNYEFATRTFAIRAYYLCIFMSLSIDPRPMDSSMIFQQRVMNFVNVGLL